MPKKLDAYQVALEMAQRSRPPSACDNFVKDGDESDIDCGGSCTACPETRACLSNSDCQSGVCENHVCHARCTDNIRDGDETGIDCGGSCPTTYTTTDGLAHYRVTAIAIDSSGGKWFGTSNGVSHLTADSTTWTTHKIADGLVDGNVDAIAIDFNW